MLMNNQGVQNSQSVSPASALWHGEIGTTEKDCGKQRMNGWRKFRENTTDFVVTVARQVCTYPILSSPVLFILAYLFVRLILETHLNNRKCIGMISPFKN